MNQSNKPCRQLFLVLLAVILMVSFLSPAFHASPVSAVDITPPSTPLVTDDGATTDNNAQLHATWTSSDPESSIAEYQYAIGTSANGTDVVGWTSTGKKTEVTKRGLSLSWGTAYYFAVMARNKQGYGVEQE